jgi:hypothetical protein
MQLGQGFHGTQLGVWSPNTQTHLHHWINCIFTFGEPHQDQLHLHDVLYIPCPIVDPVEKVKAQFWDSF